MECAAPATVTVAVSPPVLPDFGAQAAFVDAQLAASTPLASAAAAAAAPWAALREAAALAEVLNNYSLMDAADLAADAGLLTQRQLQREALVVAWAAAAATLPAAELGTAMAVFSTLFGLGTVPGVEMTQSAQALGMTTLQSLGGPAAAAAGSGGTLVAQRVASLGLCNTCIIIDSGDPAVIWTSDNASAPPFGVLLQKQAQDGVSTGMAGALASTLSAVGDSTVLSLAAVPGHTMRVAMASSQPGGALFTQPFTAASFPGDAAVWSAHADPMPTSIFDATGLASGAPVLASFQTVPFDPYFNDPSVTSMVTISFADAAGAKLSVSNLDVPVTFVMPPLGYYVGGAAGLPRRTR